MKKLSYHLLPMALLFVTAVMAMLAPASVLASPVTEAREGATAAGAQDDLNANILVVTNILVFIIGVAAVIMIIIGAIKYTTANGDQSAITSAKNTIIYSIVGLILAIMAGGIVNFVLNQF